MKIHSIVIYIILAIGCRQCLADPQQNPLDPLGLYLSRDRSLDFSQVYLPNQQDPSVEVGLQNVYPIDQQLIVQADIQRRPPISLPRIIYGIKHYLRSVFNLAKRLLFLPLSLLKFILWPVNVVFHVSKFFVKLFLLPVVIGWNLVKMTLYPFKLMLSKLFAPNPPPPYVIGLNKTPYGSYESQMYRV